MFRLGLYVYLSKFVYLVIYYMFCIFEGLDDERGKISVNLVELVVN